MTIFLERRVRGNMRWRRLVSDRAVRGIGAVGIVDVGMVAVDIDPEDIVVDDIAEPFWIRANVAMEKQRKGQRDRK